MISKIGKAENFLPLLFGLERNKLYEITIKEHRKQRSLNANKYCWVLVGEIYNEMQKDYKPKEGEEPLKKNDVYEQMLFDFGQSFEITLMNNVPVEHLGLHYKVIKEYPTYTDYQVAIGSSHYDTKQMSVLLDGIVQTAMNMGIQTMTRSEIELLKEEWANEKER